MRFLIPQGGSWDDRFAGILTTYKHRGIPRPIKAGHPWAGDNCAFKNFNPRNFVAWLDTMLPYRSTCLFITVPDKVADAGATIDMFHQWWPHLADWPLAFVAQDGQEWLEWPTSEDFTDYCYGHLAGDDDESFHDCQEQWRRQCHPWTCLFVGGSTAWKLSQAAADLIADAKAMGKCIHIGRVNYTPRYPHFRLLPGSEAFTCDGTRPRYDGRQATLTAWAGYQSQPPLLPMSRVG